MSTVEMRTPLAEAKAIATDFLELIAASCEQVEIAGSIRRQKADVGDIEVVAVPTTSRVLDMFGSPTPDLVDHLDVRLADLESDGTIARDTHAPSWGMKHKRLVFQGMTVDLYACEAGRFGWQLALRTGPAEYTHQIVTPRGVRNSDGRYGLLPPHLKFEGGWLTSRVAGARILTPDEKTLFELLGLTCLPPEQRS